MASIQKMNGKRGLSYRIIVSDGYDENYKKVRHIKNWRAPEGWSDKRAEKEVQRVACEFETQIRQGYLLDNRKTFAEYAAYVINLKERNGLKHNTVLLYQYLLERVTPKIGHMRLVEIRPFHLNELYCGLQETGVRYTEKKVSCRMNLGQLLHEKSMSREAVAKLAGVSHTTITSACRGKKIMFDRAEKIADALGKPMADLFDAEQQTARLSAKTVKEYHRFIRVVLAQAEREMLVPYNAADKATPPKAQHSEANYFQPHEIAAILDALDEEPLRWKMITHLLIVTGCRRGEIMGLKWSKVDWDNCRIKIDNNLLYSKDRGVYEGSTKTENTRYIKLPEETIKLLHLYQGSQEELRRVNGDRWHDCDFLFTQEDGQPMNPSSITAWLSAFSKRHNLPHINPHAFRHTVASVLIAGGLDIVTVSKQLGHSKVSTTDDYYAHIIDAEKSKASECIADVMLRRDKE